jgi:uncharacterized protein YcfJ
MSTRSRIASTALALAAMAVATQAAAQITFYENDRFEGRSFTTDRAVGNFINFGFNDRASSITVARDSWQVCEDVAFNGRCVVLRPGRYDSLSAMGLNDRISSTRIVSANTVFEDERGDRPARAYDYQRRDQERLYQANVVNVHAVLGTPEQRCWVEREQVAGGRGEANVPGAVAGAVIGGILGHQIGGGFGRDVATAGGVVAGAAVGANVGRGDAPNYGRDVQRCSNVPGSGHPAYWDVTYNFRGQDHRMQMTAAPGPTVTVNRLGEPRS